MNGWLIKTVNDKERMISMCMYMGTRRTSASTVMWYSTVCVCLCVCLVYSFPDNSRIYNKALKTCSPWHRKHDLFCTLLLKFPSGISPLILFLFTHFLQVFHTPQPLKCQGSRVKHMQHGLQFITPHLPDSFSLLTSLGKSCSLFYNVWGLG